MNVDDCFQERTLRKIEPNEKKVEKSIEIAELKLDEAKKLFSAGFYDSSIIAVYTSMFHAARAVLYKDGVQEKSPNAVYIYLNERYSTDIRKSLLNSFNQFKDERHMLLYGFEGETQIEEVENAITDCEEFLESIKRIID